MKIVSIIMLILALFLSNTAMAEDELDAEKFSKAKMKMLETVSAHLKVLDTFKSCLEDAEVRPEVAACRKSKKTAIKALKMKEKRTRAKRLKAKAIEKKLSEEPSEMPSEKAE